MKWRKRFLMFVLFLAVFAGTLGFTAWWLARGAPEWYAARRLDPKEAEAAANRAEQQLQRTLSWAQDQQATLVRKARGVASTQAVQSLEISFTQDELNGFFQKWDSTFGWSDAYGRYLSDPQVALRDGRLILAATVNDLGAVLSIELQPRLVDAKLSMPVTRVLAGRLPLPRLFWDRYRTRLESAVDAHLPLWQREAQINPLGGANTDTVAAAMCELLLDILADRPAPPVLFLPYAVRNKPRSLPVRLTNIEIADNVITLTVEPMDAGQRQAVLEAIRNFKPTTSATGTLSASPVP